MTLLVIFKGRLRGQHEYEEHMGSKETQEIHIYYHLLYARIFVYTVSFEP